MTTNRLSEGAPTKFSLKHLTPKERLDWAMSNNAEVNAARRKDGLAPIRWVLRDDKLHIEFVHQPEGYRA